MFFVFFGCGRDGFLASKVISLHYYMFLGMYDVLLSISSQEHTKLTYLSTGGDGALQTLDLLAYNLNFTDSYFVKEQTEGD